MSKIKKGLTVDRDVGDPMRRPRPVSQEGYYYPEEHVNEKQSIQSMRQYGSSASLEVRHEQNRRQREQEFFAPLPSATPKNSRHTPVSRNADSTTYYQQSAGQTNNYQSRLLPNTYNAHLDVNQNSYHSNSSGFLTPQPLLSNNSRQPTPNPYNNQRSMQQPQNSMNLQRPSQDASPSPSSEHYQDLYIPPGHRNQQQQQQHHHHSSKNQSKIEAAPILDNKNFQPDPISIEDYISQAIKYHEDDQLEKSTEYLKIAAEKGSAVGKVLYGIALRHGWGCKVNEALAFSYLNQAAESAMSILNGINKSVSMSSFRGEIILAIYELGVCFRHGWGVLKSKATAAHYFEIAANMGDPDAQNDIAYCYYKGEGVKKDMKKSAKYYRMADAQGHGTMGNSWIFKEKYNSDKK